MKTLPLSLLAHMAGGELQGEDVVVDTVIQDTRSLQPGSLYVALRGERFDGHDFAYDAAMRGAGDAVLGDHLQRRVDDAVAPGGIMAAFACFGHQLTFAAVMDICPHSVMDVCP